MCKGQCSKVASMIQQVKHLQQVFNNPAPTEFTSAVTVHEEAYNQIAEELQEFDRDIITALVKRDGTAEEHTRDWVVDMMFYLLQYANKVGVIDNIEQDFYKIYMNNITKCTDHDNAVQTCVTYNSEGIDCYVDQNRFGDWLIRRKSDGKILKPIGYQSVEL